MPLFTDYSKPYSNMHYSGSSYSSSSPYSSYVSSSVPLGSSLSASYLGSGGNYSTHSSLVGYNRAPFTPRWTPSSARNYSPILSTISERGTSSPIRISSPRRIHISKSYLPSSYTPRPININTADIDVSRDKYRCRTKTESVTPVIVPTQVEVTNKNTDNGPFMPRIDGKPETGVDSSPGSQRSTIKRGRTVVRLHTVKRKERDSPRKPQELLSQDADILDNKPLLGIQNAETENQDTGGGWRDKLSEDLQYKEKRERKTLGEKLVEKFKVKDKNDSGSAISSELTCDNTYLRNDLDKNKLGTNTSIISSNRSPDRRCSLELLAEQANLLDSLIRSENLSTALLDLSKVGVSDNKQIGSIKRRKVEGNLQTTKSDYSLHDRVKSLNDKKEPRHFPKRRSLKKSSSGGSICRLDSITEFPKEPIQYQLPAIEESRMSIKNETSKAKQQKTKITSSVEISQPTSALKFRVENVTVEEKPCEIKKGITFHAEVAMIETPIQETKEVVTMSDENKCNLSNQGNHSTEKEDSDEADSEGSNFWDKIGKRETVYLHKRKEKIQDDILQNRRAMYWYPEEKESGTKYDIDVNQTQLTDNFEITQQSNDQTKTISDKSSSCQNQNILLKNNESKRDILQLNNDQTLLIFESNTICDGEKCNLTNSQNKDNEEITNLNTNCLEITNEKEVIGTNYASQKAEKTFERHENAHKSVLINEHVTKDSFNSAESKNNVCLNNNDKMKSLTNKVTDVNSFETNTILTATNLSPAEKDKNETLRTDDVTFTCKEDIKDYNLSVKKKDMKHSDANIMLTATNLSLVEKDKNETLGKDDVMFKCKEDIKDYNLSDKKEDESELTKEAIETNSAQVHKKFIAPSTSESSSHKKIKKSKVENNVSAKTKKEKEAIEMNIQSQVATKPISPCESLSHTKNKNNTKKKESTVHSSAALEKSPVIVKCNSARDVSETQQKSTKTNNSDINDLTTTAVHEENICTQILTDVTCVNKISSKEDNIPHPIENPEMKKEIRDETKNNLGEENKSETNDPAQSDSVPDSVVNKDEKQEDSSIKDLIKLPVSPVVKKPVKQEPATRPLIATPRPLQKKAPQIIHSSSSSESSSESSEDEDNDDADESDASGESSEFYECETNPDGRTSTGSNDSGFDSSAPTSPAGFVFIKKDCDVNCHRKCEKLTANLCGVNQRLLVEALACRTASKRGGETAGAVASGSNASASGGAATDVLEQELEASTAYGLFKKTGRFTPPARSIPRFRKYTIEDFHFIKVLGKGSFGKVLLAELRETEYYYAVKCLKKDVVLEDDDVECTLIERKVLALGTNHPYLCHLFATFQSDSHLFFVMEYLNGGDLMFHIQQSGRFPEPRARFYAAEIVSGLKFLHKRGIVYRDLKLDNILLDFDGHVRIADFGMCKLQIYLDKTADTFCGTPDYMAPEIIKGLKYSQAVDWWSFGVLLYEMLIGQSPFSGCDEDELFWSICNEMPSYPRFLSTEALTILTRLLDKDARTRMGGAECMHGDVRDQDFFRPIHWERLERRELDAPFKPRVRHPLDTQYFDRAFTGERPRLTAVEPQVLRSMDQEPFRGFSYTNPNATDR